MSNLEVKSCPVCGEMAYLTAFVYSDGKTMAWVRCSKCELTTKMTDSIDDVLYFWNKRVGEKSV